MFKKGKLATLLFLHKPKLYRYAVNRAKLSTYNITVFRIIPNEQFSSIKDMRKYGIVMLGNFHIHPGSPSRPSKEDKRLAFDQKAMYMILSLQDEKNPILKSFLIKENVVQ